jgi:hypothetical protein
MPLRLLARLSLLFITLIGAAIVLLPSHAARAADDADVLVLVNQHRADNGLPPLCLNSLLNQAATAHSQDMLANNYFSHTGLNGSQPWDRIRATGYKGSYFAENIALGYQSAAEVFEGWRTSPGHNANMLSADATEMGLARVGDYWTQVFGNGRPCGTTPAPATRDLLPVSTPAPVVPPPAQDVPPPAPDAPPSAPDMPPPAPDAPPPPADAPHEDIVFEEEAEYDAWVNDMTESGYTCTTTTWVDEFGVTWECTTCVSH